MSDAKPLPVYFKLAKGYESEEYVSFSPTDINGSAELTIKSTDGAHVSVIGVPFDRPVWVRVRKGDARHNFGHGTITVTLEDGTTRSFDL